MVLKEGTVDLHGAKERKKEKEKKASVRVRNDQCETLKSGLWHTI